MSDSIDDIPNKPELSILQHAHFGSVEIEQVLEARGMKITGVVMAIEAKDGAQGVAYFSQRVNVDQLHALGILDMVKDTIMHNEFDDS